MKDLKVLIIEDYKPHFEYILNALLDIDVEYSSIYPYLYSAFIKLKLDDKLDSNNYSKKDDFTLFKDLFKRIKDDNREDIFKLLNKSIDFNSFNYIVLDIGLKGSSDNEGLQLYKFILDLGFNKEKIIIVSSLSLSNTNEELKKVDDSLDKITKNQHEIKSDSGVYGKKIANTIKDLENE